MAQPLNVQTDAPRQMHMLTPFMTEAPAFGSPTLSAFSQASQVLNQMQFLRVQQIRRKRDLMGCEFNNWYLIKDGFGQDVFFVKEDSSCLERHCGTYNCKSWRMDVALLGPQGMHSLSATPFLHLERPCTFTCCCLNRPKVFVTESNGGQAIGTLEDPCVCCRVATTINEVGNPSPTLSADASQCQFGWFCRCPGQAIEVPVKDIASSHHVAKITKIWTLGDVCPICDRNWSTLDVQFGKQHSSNIKLLLMSTAIFLQMLFFDPRNENNDRNDNNNN